MLFPIVSRQGGGDCLLGFFTPDISVESQPGSVPLSFDNVPNDLHAGCPGYIGNHMMKLEVHLYEGLLYMLNMGCGIFDESFSVTEIGPKTGDLLA